MPRRKDIPAQTITLERELEFYYSDLNGSNFIFSGADGHIILYIIDFEEAGFLPHSFQSFALECMDRPASTRVAVNIRPLIKHDKANLAIMETLSGFLECCVSEFGKFHLIGVSAQLATPTLALSLLRPATSFCSSQLI